MSTALVAAGIEQVMPRGVCGNTRVPRNETGTIPVTVLPTLKAGPSMRSGLMTMRHGRSHEEREQKVGRDRRGTTPESKDAARLGMSAKGGTPHQRVFGAHNERFARGEDLDEPEPTGSGSDVAPTERAARREQERHRIERRLGRMAAGSDENLRDRREPGVSRETLDKAAREADEKVKKS